MATYSFINTQLTMTGPGASAVNLGYGSASAEEGITVEMVEEKNMMYIGADGTPMHTLRATRGATLTVRLEKTSPQNRILSDIYAYQTSLESGGLFHGQNVFTLTDVARGDSYTMSQAAFKRFPRVNWAKDGDIVEWEFDVGICDPLIGAGIEGIAVGV
jgi:hypothetical protein